MLESRWLNCSRMTDCWFWSEKPVASPKPWCTTRLFFDAQCSEVLVAGAAKREWPWVLGSVALAPHKRSAELAAKWPAFARPSRCENPHFGGATRAPDFRLPSLLGFSIALCSRHSAVCEGCCFRHRRAVANFLCAVCFRVVATPGFWAGSGGLAKLPCEWSCSNNMGKGVGMLCWYVKVAEMSLGLPWWSECLDTSIVA